MIVKQPDDKYIHIQQLEALLQGADEKKKGQIDREIRMLRAGIKGENEAAYLINFHYGASNRTAVIHDLRIELGGRVAQIDHLLIHRTLNVFVLESKHFHAGVKILEDGEFLMWNDYRRKYEGMASPLAQNERHVEVLNDAFTTITMPARLGVRLSPVCHSYVLVSPNARIVRPRKFDSSHVIKADVLDKTVESNFDKAGFFDVLGSASRMVAHETLQDIAEQLVALHQPAQFNYAARFGISNDTTETEPELRAEAVLRCRACGSNSLAILHGRFGYYFKCAACDGNTPIQIGCGHAGHKERIRKQGLNFYRECADCGTSSLFYVNQTSTS